MTDPVALTQSLVRAASVTPEAEAPIALLGDMLRGAGFETTRVDRGGVANLFARWGPRGHPRTFGFNGHVDVVPVGPAADWSVDPFGGEVRDGRLYGRGACDMKSGVAAFVAAALDLVASRPPDGAVVLAITGDEEGDAVDGTAALLDWMAGAGEAMTHCLVGEPTCPDRMGEMVKIGRRGSLTATVTATGRQGHVAYPARAANPIPALVRLFDRLGAATLDDGTDHFEPSRLVPTTLDVGNPATNVIPSTARGVLNIRFNDRHSGAALTEWLQAEAAAVAAETGIRLDLAARVSAAPFLTPPGPLSDLVAGAVAAITGVTPVLSTSGGTSDARFVRDHCPVVEFGLVGDTMHQADESVAVDQITALRDVYARILEGYFA